MGDKNISVNEEKFILSQNISKDDSKINLIKKDHSSNVFTRLNQSVKKGLSEKSFSNKSYKEDEDLEKEKIEMSLKSNEKSQHEKNFESRNESAQDSRLNEGARQLKKRERICDTDTEDEGSDNEKEVSWILLPENAFKKVWDMLIALIILYSSIITPYEIAFLEENLLSEVDIGCDIVLGVDIIINFFSAYVDNEDNIVKNRKKIIITYLKTWFTIDLISVLPLSYFTTHQSYKFNNLTRIGRLPKLYRLLKLTKLLRMSKISKKGNINRVTKFFIEKLKVNANIERLVFFILSFLLLNHLSACIWYYMAKLQDLSPDCWVTRLGYIDSTNFEIYVISFYWTLTTVTTVGYGDISAGTTIERAYNLIIMSFGVLMYSFAIGSLSSIVSTLDQKTAEMNQKLQILSSIKKEFNLDQEIYDKVRKVIKYDLSRNQKDKMNFLQELPNKLRIELSQIMHDKAIQNLYFFKDQPSDFIAYVAPLLKPVKFSQNDFLYKTGDMIDEMYFISKGTVILCLGKNYSEKEIKEVKKNNNFSEIEMCLNEKLTFNIKVKSRSCELFVLKKNDFLRLSVNFKEFIENFLHKSLMIYLKFNEDKKKLTKEEESRMNKKDIDKINQCSQKQHLEIVDEEKEDGDLNDYDIYDESDDKSEIISDKVQVDDKEEVEDFKSQKYDKNSEYLSRLDSKKNSSPQIMMEPKELFSNIYGDSNNLFKKNTSKSIKQMVGEGENLIRFDQEEENNILQNSIQSDIDEPLDKMKNEINKKFIKKIDKILQCLEMSNFNFNNAENNPKMLLKQLRSEANIMGKNNIIDKIESILKEYYKDQSLSHGN